MTQLFTSVETIRAAIFDVIDGGYQCDQAYGLVRGGLIECNLWHPWQFTFTVPETDDENQRRAAFVDSVIARIVELKSSPHHGVNLNNYCGRHLTALVQTEPPSGACPTCAKELAERKRPVAVCERCDRRFVGLDALEQLAGHAAVDH